MIARETLAMLEPHGYDVVMSVSLQTLARERGTTYTADTPSTENRRSSWTGTSPEHLARVFSLKLRAATGRTHIKRMEAAAG